MHTLRKLVGIIRSSNDHRTEGVKLLQSKLRAGYDRRSPVGIYEPSLIIFIQRARARLPPAESPVTMILSGFMPSWDCPCSRTH